MLTIYQLCTGMTKEEVLEECGAMRWGDFKPALTDAVVEHLSPIQARYAEIIEEEGYLDGVLKRGADAANEVASVHRDLADGGDSQRDSDVVVVVRDGLEGDRERGAEVDERPELMDGVAELVKDDHVSHAQEVSEGRHDVDRRAV